jgi:hypothetical protein
MAFPLLHRKNTSAPALTAVLCPNRVGPAAGVLSERMGMYQDDKTRLEETLAEYERLRKFLRDLDERAEQVDERQSRLNLSCQTTTFVPTIRR